MTENNNPDARQRDMAHTELMEKIRALSFVKEELELYLDTHPGCKIALDYYHQTMQALDALTEQYQNTHGPLTAAGVTDQNRWTWVDTPWPWHRPEDLKGVRGREK